MLIVVISPTVVVRFSTHGVPSVEGTWWWSTVSYAPRWRSIVHAVTTIVSAVVRRWGREEVVTATSSLWRSIGSPRRVTVNGILWCRYYLFRFVNGRFPTFHGQSVQFDRRSYVTDIGFSARFGSIGFGRRMLILGSSDGFVGGTVLSLLDARAFGRIFFIAQLERDGEAFLVGRARFAG